MMDRYLDFQNGYKVMYEAKDKITEEAPGPVYASTILQRVQDKMCISYNAVTGEYVDLSQFKLIYADYRNLIGSVSGLPSADDIRIVIKDTDGKIVLGEGSEEPPVPPTPKFKVTVSCNSSDVILTGDGEYEEGAEVTVTLAPADGFEFAEDNAPMVGDVAMTESAGLFIHTFVMEAADIDVDITGVSMKALPVACDVFYKECFSADEALDDSWESADAPADVERVALTMNGEGDEDVFPSIAVNTSVHAEIRDILDAAGTSMIAVFAAPRSVNYAGSEYKVYSFEDGATAQEYSFTVVF